MKTFPNLSSEIEKISNEEASFLGMDGGNIKSNLWFCGVEFGATFEEMENYYSNVVKYEKVEELEIPYRDDCPEKFVKSCFDRRLALIYLILTQESKNTKTKEIDEVLTQELYHKDSKIFKLNLFPLAKTSLSWNKDIENKMGFSKEDYYGSFFDNRISFIKKLVKRFSPKTILCFSPKGYSELFIDTFFDNKKSILYKKDFIPLENGSKAKIKILINQYSKVIIIPFLGRGNLSSYVDVRKMTSYLKENYL